jgi:hypothetical protein
LTLGLPDRSFTCIPAGAPAARPTSCGAPHGISGWINPVSTEQLSTIDSHTGSEPSPPGEFRRYRKFVSWFILGFILIGSSYMLLSVAVTIYRRQHAVLLGSPVGVLATKEDAESCFDELSDVSEGLLKYLENSHTLMANNDPGEVQSWAEAGSYWRGQWRAVGERCGFERRRGAQNWAKNWEEMAVLHEELRETEVGYTKEISLFGKELAPRLGRLRERLARIGERLSLPHE